MKYLTHFQFYIHFNRQNTYLVSKHIATVFTGAKTCVVLNGDKTCTYYIYAGIKKNVLNLCNQGIKSKYVNLDIYIDISNAMIPDIIALINESNNIAKVVIFISLNSQYNFRN